MASTYLSRTGIGSSNNQKKWTFSGWFKKCLNGSEQRLITSSDNSSYDDNIRFNAGDTMKVVFNNATVLNTNRLFRDNNAYYHILVKVDTDQSTANDRIVLYINGVDERTVGGYSTSSMPNQGTTGYINYAQHYIGVTNPSANSNHFNGIMSHVHFTDGYAYTPTSFGETDSTTGEWKIKTSPSVSYGTTGFWILKDGNSVTDSSPNSNTFTVSAGTLTKTEDCASNVFATWNSLYRTNASNFAYGNTESQSPSTGGFAGISTLGASSGKYYAEFKLQAASTSYEACIAVMVGSSISGNDLPSGYPEYTVGSYGIRQGDASSGNSFWTTAAGGRTSGAAHGGFSIGDTIGIALDIDNNRVYFSKGGQWNNSGSWNSATPSTYLTLISTYGDGQYLFVSGDSSGGNTAKWSANFGNGYQQSTAVSSAGTNASGIGIFEYDVPTGYTALSTKGLNI